MLHAGIKMQMRQKRNVEVLSPTVLRNTLSRQINKVVFVVKRFC